MPATSANPSAAWFVKELTNAHVFEPIQLAPYLSEFKSTHRSGGDALVLADFLIKSGLLTRYQADRCLAGAANKLVLGPYFLTEFVGSGSIGEVFQAIGRSDRKRYAVKVLPLRSLWNVRQAKKQLSDFAALPDHPAIVPFVDIDSAAGSHYLAWPYVEGHTLAARVKEKGPATIPAAIQVMMQAAEGLAVCHAHGISHGLINPSNLLIGIDGQIRILDLGVGAILSENIADDESMFDTLSASNATMGMIDCCAPETLNSPTLRDPASDIYSFGCTFYYLLTGQLPYPDGNVVDKVLAHQTLPPPSARALNPNVPAWIDELIQRLMAKSPDDRPAHLTEIRIELESGSSKEYVELPEHPEEKSPEPAADFMPSTPLDVHREIPKSEVTPTQAHVQELTYAPPPRRISHQPQSVSEIDFGDYTTPDENDNSGWNTISPLKQVEPLIPHSETETLQELQSATQTMPSAMPEQFSYIETTEAQPEMLRPSIPSSPVVPKIKKPQWSWFKSLFNRVEKRESDLVQFSVFGPSHLTPGQSVRWQVFVHLPESFESVCTLSRAFHSDSTLLSTNFLDQPVKHNANLGLQLKVANAGVAQSETTLSWQGQSKPRAFDVHVPWECPAGKTTASMFVDIDGVLVGEFSFQIHILPRRG